jgi:hypothetical protein
VKPLPGHGAERRHRKGRHMRKGKKDERKKEKNRRWRKLRDKYRVDMRATWG